MTIPTSKQRISWIDMAKGYGTILVIFAHIHYGLLRTWIYTFHMPLFFFLSGYVFKENYGFGEFLKKKVKTIVIPYFCLGLPMVLYEAWRISGGRKEQLSQSMWSLFKDLVRQERLWTLWFISCLFCLNILFYVLVKVCRKLWILGVVSAVLPVLGLMYYKAGGGYWYWNADAAFMALPFFFAGYLMKQYASMVDAFLQVKWRKWTLFCGLLVTNLVCGVLSLDREGTGLEMFYSKYGNPVFTYASAFAGIVCVLILARCATYRPICYLGENTMLYYAWHQTIMMPVVEGLLASIGITALVGTGMLYKIIWLLVIIGITTACIWIMKKLHLDFMLGR